MVVLLAGVLAGTAEARLGDTLGQLKDKLGKVVAEPQRNSAVWYVETRGGTLAYTVVFDRKGRSISEALRPIQDAEFSVVSAEGFINIQIEPYRASKTLHAVKPGEKFTFGGKEFVCTPQQWVIIDAANDLLIVWTRVGLTSVTAVRAEAMNN